LDPVLAGLRANGSGITGMDLIAADGVIMYSEDPAKTGLRVAPAEQWQLDEALVGRVTALRDSAPSGTEPQDDVGDDRTFDVYVPVIVGGVIVGAYELDVRLPQTPLNHPIMLTLLSGVLGSSLSCLLRLAVVRMRHGETRPPEPADSVVIAQHQPLANTDALGRLTQRELDVLRSLAIGALVPRDRDRTGLGRGNYSQSRQAHSAQDRPAEPHRAANGRPSGWDHRHAPMRPQPAVTAVPRPTLVHRRGIRDSIGRIHPHG
jgi:hypothetical protein